VSSSLTAQLQAYLAGDTALTTACPGGVWVYPAPDGQTQPFVTIEQSGSNDEGCGITRATYEVVAVAPAASVAAGRTADARIQALLDGAYPTLTGFTVLGCRATAEIDGHDEEIAGRWVRLGGEYTLLVE